MGSRLTAGRDHNDLVDRLVQGSHIQTMMVEKVFRAVDRADYLLPSDRKQAYRDMAWRRGIIHLSSPCIYSEVLDALELSPGLTFLNLGSGTGYLSTMVGLVLGVNGVNHGVEVNPSLIDYAAERLQNFIKNSPAIDEFDFCHPTFIAGNCLCLPQSIQQYDRVYCGAACPKKYEFFLKNLIKVGGILVMPVDDNLFQIKRTSEAEWTTNDILSVTFSTLIAPTPQQATEHVDTSELDVTPAPLQVLCRSLIRNVLRNVVYEEKPHVREIPLRLKKNFKSKRKESSTRRISIHVPVHDGNDDLAGFQLDPESGALEMNALFHLVFMMGANRAPSRDDYVSDDESSMSMESSDGYETAQSVPNREPSASDNEQSRLHMKRPHSSDDDDDDNDSNIMSALNSFNGIVRNNIPHNSRNGRNNSQVLTEPSSSSEFKANNNDSADSNKHLNKDLSDIDSSEDESANTSKNLDGTSPFNNHHRKRRYTEGDQLSDIEGDISSDSDSIFNMLPTVRVKKMKKRVPLPPNPGDILRQHLSKLLKDKVQQLPLPPPLKVYVNMNRDF